SFSTVLSTFCWHAQPALSLVHDFTAGSRFDPKMSAMRSVSPCTAALPTVVALVKPKLGGVPQFFVASALTFAFDLATFPFASAVRHACAVPVSCPLPAPFRHETFSLPCVFATPAPSLFAPLRHFCWSADCCANAPDAPSVSVNSA